MKYIVYLTINTVNRKYYVGVHQTKDPNVYDGYIGCGIFKGTTINGNKNAPFQRAVKKYGYDKFERLTLGIFDTPEEAYKQEAAIVTKEFIERSDTYNARLGGEYSGTHSTKILQYTADGKFLKLWPSIKEAYEFFNKKSGNRLIKCLGGKTQTYLGFQWRYHTEDYPLVIIPAAILNIPICQYSENGLFLKLWKSKMEAARDLECSHSALRHATISRKLYFGFQWRYFIDSIPDFIGKYINPDIVLQLDKDTGEVIKEYPQLVDALRADFKVDRNMKPRTIKASKYNWIYKVNYQQLDCDIVQED